MYSPFGDRSRTRLNRDDGKKRENMFTSQYVYIASSQSGIMKSFKVKVSSSMRDTTRRKCCAWHHN